MIIRRFVNRRYEGNGNGARDVADFARRVAEAFSGICKNSPSMYGRYSATHAHTQGNDAAMITMMKGSYPFLWFYCVQSGEKVKAVYADGSRFGTFGLDEYDDMASLMIDCL